jgi:hypothetical protein
LVNRYETKITPMRATVDRKDFEEVLKKAKLATEKKTAIPILNNFKLFAKDDKLSIYATDLENFVIFELPARVEEAGEVSVHANKLTSIVKELSSAEVYMELAEDKLIIRGGKSQFKLVCADPSEFPEFPEVQCKNAIPSNLLLKGISKVGMPFPKRTPDMPFRVCMWQTKRESFTLWVLMATGLPCICMRKFLLRKTFFSPAKV